MEIDLALFAQHARVYPDRRWDAFGVFVQLTADVFPFVFGPYVVVIRFIVPPSDFDRPHQIDAELWDPDEQMLARVVEHYPLTVEARPEDPTEPRVFDLRVDCPPTTFPTPGTYHIRLFVDRHHRKNMLLSVRRQDTPRPTARSP